MTASDGKYSYSATSGFYRIDVVAAGYQPYRTADLDAGAGSISPNIALSPVINEAATQTIYITENGYLPASVKVQPNSVVEFVNVDVSEHASKGSNWDSGLLAPGQSYKVKLTTLGTYQYSDSAATPAEAQIIVGEAVAGGNSIYLPLVSR